jgi:hypothetical protein
MLCLDCHKYVYVLDVVRWLPSLLFIVTLLTKNYSRDLPPTPNIVIKNALQGQCHEFLDHWIFFINQPSSDP